MVVRYRSGCLRTISYCRHNIWAFIKLSCYLNCFIEIAYIMLNTYSDSDSDFVHSDC